ncbi:hypothetical protein PIB30_055250, partial [Stylosanthes scabra]|nr:hypothetical protein [Stylosanthes scabra]
YASTKHSLNVTAVRSVSILILVIVLQHSSTLVLLLCSKFMYSEGSSSRNQHDWDSDDELEVFGIPQETNEHSVTIMESGSACSTAKNRNLIHHFLGMGFSVEEVIKAIDKDGEDNEENILERLLTLAATIEDPMGEASREQCDSAKKSVTAIDISDDGHTGPETEEDTFTSEKDEALSILVNMGYPFKDALIAIDTCGTSPGADLGDLTDFICAAQLTKEIESHLKHLPNRKHDASLHMHKRSRDHYYNGKKKSRMRRASQKKPLEMDMEEIELSIPTNGFSTAKGIYPRVARKLPDKLVAPLEPDEYEMLLGFPKDHTRGGGISRTDRYKALGNAFQVDTVAYHLSVLKDQYPNGMNVLSLFSGIGGAEVALHRLGIKLNNVVSVEVSEVNRNIIRCWWEQTEQRGNLFEVEDVQRVTTEHIMQWITRFGGFDLVIGGSPCNNLSGSNRVSRDGLEGEHSSLFYEYYRIVNEVIQAQR